MRTTTRIELFLEGLNCANCAAKIEERVNTIEHTEGVSLNLATNMLTIGTKDKGKRGQIVSKVRRIVKDIEPTVRVADKTGGETAAGRGGEGARKAASVLGVLFFVAALILALPVQLKLGLYIASYLLIGGGVLFTAARNLFKGRVFDENFLMSISTIGALAIGEYPEAVAVMLFYRLGEFMQDLAVNRSRNSIADLMDIRPEYANIKWGDQIERVPPDRVKVGYLILVKPGEKIPLDGRVVEGTSAVDTSALTGEPMPRDVAAGAEVLAGFINKNGMLTVQVNKAYKESAVARILELVENAGARKAPTEKFITKFARYYTPAVVFAAAALAVVPSLVVEGANFSDWLYRALVFLVVSCPCALVVSIPLGFFGGIGGASRHGILIKGGNFLEGLAKVDTVIFDKTGTLTRGIFKVTQVNPVDGVGREELIEYAARAEYGSNHPVALSILEEAASQGNTSESPRADSHYEIPGLGVSAQLDGEKIFAGNARLMDRENIAFQPADANGTVIYVAVDRRFIGSIVVSDVVKDDAADAIRGLKSLGVNRTVMLTGDVQRSALETANTLGIDQVHYELMPHRKVEWIETAQRDKASKGKVVFVGDGINDAPALARADIGVAMGGLGSDAAIQAADVVIMTDQPGKLVKAVGIARRTRAIVWQNVVFALGIKAVVLALGAGGSASMWEAVFADVGVALIAVLNSMRAMRI